MKQYIETNKDRFFEELFSRLDQIELDGAPRWIQSNFVGGLKNLPIRFKMRERASALGAA